jgi:hypothetical protein
MEFLSKNKGQPSNTSTQRYVDVESIRNGVMILKSGGLRSIVLVSSINFELKSSVEQEAIIAQYQNFLNSLDFPVQVVIQSRRFNITPYLERLKGEEAQQVNELLRLQISEYREFIKNLNEVSNIVAKQFYIVVPFSTVESNEGGFFQTLSNIFNQKKAVNMKGELFESFRSQLLQRVEHVMNGLSPIGLRGTLLGTEEIIELLYNSYNPSLFTTSIIKNVDQVELTPTR